MDKLHFSIIINAPKKKVWNTMLDDDTYRVWTEVFMPGSHYVGDWSKGSKILFLAPDQEGRMSGMVSRIEEYRPYDHISIEHLGEVKNGKEVVSDKSSENWSGAHENYFFKDKDGSTEVLVEMDAVEEFREMFENIWPQALKKLKELAEKK
jgi:uncharacterized protein YndB with AHSA1/START domain